MGASHALRSGAGQATKNNSQFGPAGYGRHPHDALKLEFELVQRSYKEALEKLDALALVVGKAQIAQSHQRQFSLKADETQARISLSIFSIISKIFIL